MELVTIDDKEFAIFKSSSSYGVSTFRVLNKQENLDRFAKRLTAANKPPKTDAQRFDALRKEQFRTRATPAERARAELCREFDIWTESEAELEFVEPLAA